MNYKQSQVRCQYACSAGCGTSFMSAASEALFMVGVLEEFVRDNLHYLSPAKQRLFLLLTANLDENDRSTERLRRAGR